MDPKLQAVIDAARDVVGGVALENLRVALVRYETQAPAQAEQQVGVEMMADMARRTAHLRGEAPWPNQAEQQAGTCRVFCDSCPTAERCTDIGNCQFPKAEQQGGGGAIYQAWEDNGWRDVSKSSYERTSPLNRRIVYGAPQPSDYVLGGWRAARAAEGREAVDEQVKRLRRTLYQIAHWPDGGNAYGQDKIKKYALSVLDGDPPSQDVVDERTEFESR